MYNTATEEFLGFTFDGISTNEFNLTVVSDGSRYHSPLFGNLANSTLKVPGRNGSYYFGSEFESVPISFNLAFDNLTNDKFIQMKKWLNSQGLKKLILNETPYRYYWAKIASMPTLDFVPFEKIYKLGAQNVKGLIYKGELNLEFVAYDPYGYKVPEINVDSYFGNGVTEIPIWFLGSGLLPSNYSYSTIAIGATNSLPLTGVGFDYEFYLYNGGNEDTDVNFSFTIEKDFVGDLEIENDYNDDITIIRPIPSDAFTILEAYSGSTILNYRITINGITKKATAIGKNSGGITITEEKLIGQYHNGIFMKVAAVASTQLIKLKAGTYQFDWVAEYDVRDFTPSDSGTMLPAAIPTYTGYYCSSLGKCVAFSPSYIALTGDVGKIAFLIKPNKYIINRVLLNINVEYYYKYL